MTLEIIIGIIAVLVVVYFVAVKGPKEDLEPTLKADKAAAEEPVKDMSDIALAQKPSPKKATKKAAKVDLDSMKKGELLAHAKANGVKANASMNKAELIEKIKNG